jgi:hypothetical protein
MKRQLDMDKIAKGLGADRRGKLQARSGYFGAMQLLADIEGRFQVPSGGGRPTDPAWTERRLLPLAPKTLKKLEEISARVREHGVNVEPMQLAALLVETKSRPDRSDYATTSRQLRGRSSSQERSVRPATYSIAMKGSDVPFTVSTSSAYARGVGRGPQARCVRRRRSRCSA